MNYFITILMLFIFILTIFSGRQMQTQQKINELFNKKEVTILVTDSGLGGLSVAADLAAKMPKSGVFKKAHIVFFNALFHSGSGYNYLKSDSEKVRIFDIVLNAMDNQYHPDLLLIACNTLSVIYDQTPFSKKATFPVVGIVEKGVDLIAKQLQKNRLATALIFGMQTTIEANAHQRLLVQRGFSAEKIISQACPLLADYIEEGYNSEMTALLISEFVGQAIKQLKQPGAPAVASLNCTHFGYSKHLFVKAFAEAGYDNVTIIDPNPEMSDFLFASKYLNRYPTTEVTVEVVSKTRITEQKMKSLCSLVELISAQTGFALKNYRYEPELFEAKFDSSKIEF